MRVMQTRFDSRVKEFESLTASRVHDYEQVLLGMRGLFAASLSVGRSEFRDYVVTLGLEKNFPGTQGVCFSQVVAPEQKDRHIAAVRKQGFPAYTITPETPRDFYTTAIYLEPFTGRNQRAFGFDNFTDPTRRAAMEQARDTGELSLSGKVIQLHEDNKNQSSIRIYLPVYQKGAPTLTAEQRRKNILGWLYMPIRMDDFMRDALGERSGRVDVEIFDGENNIARVALMYDSDISRSHLTGETRSLFRTVKTINLHGHKWTVAAHSLPSFDARIDEGKQALIIYSGAGISLLLAVLAGMLMYGRARVLKEAHAVARSEARLSSVIETALDAVIQLDDDGRVVGWNSQADIVFGWSREIAMGQVLEEIVIPAAYRKVFRACMDKFRVAPGNFTDSGWGAALSARSELFALNRGGREFPIELSMTQNMLDDGNCLYTAFIRDISERKAAEARMERLAHHDTLTDLPTDPV
ncbi:MAG: CHASE domain-containing protein [Nitrosomonadales bacterium]|nr:CHASE domain-containing protein [Nitrosomonadales bacterium]